jgi:hypothetical protein
MPRELQGGAKHQLLVLLGEVDQALSHAAGGTVDADDGLRHE